MEQYIPKSAVVVEIRKRLLPTIRDKHYDEWEEGQDSERIAILEIIDTLEVREVNTWHLQEKEDIYDVVKDWGLYAFACIMKDGTIQRFNGCRDEDCKGHVHAHIDGVNDDYDNVDNIVKWIEFT